MSLTSRQIPERIADLHIHSHYSRATSRDLPLSIWRAGRNSRACRSSARATLPIPAGWQRCTIHWSQPKKGFFGSSPKLRSEWLHKHLPPARVMYALCWRARSVTSTNAMMLFAKSTTLSLRLRWKSWRASNNAGAHRQYPRRWSSHLGPGLTRSA